MTLSVLSSPSSLSCSPVLRPRSSLRSHTSCSSSSSSPALPKQATALAAGALASLVLGQAPLNPPAARAESESAPALSAEDKKKKAEALKAALKQQYSIVTAEETKQKNFVTTSAPEPKAKTAPAKAEKAEPKATSSGEGPDQRLLLAFAVLFAPLSFPLVDSLKNSVLLVKKIITTGEGLY